MGNICSKVMRSDNVQKCSNVYLSLEDQEHTSKSILKDIVEKIHDEKIIEDESFIFSEKKQKLDATHSVGLDDSSVTCDDIDNRDLEKMLASMID